MRIDKMDAKDQPMEIKLSNQDMATIMVALMNHSFKKSLGEQERINALADKIEIVMNSEAVYTLKRDTNENR